MSSVPVASLLDNEVAFQLDNLTEVFQRQHALILIFSGVQEAQANIRLHNIV